MDLDRRKKEKERQVVFSIASKAAKHQASDYYTEKDNYLFYISNLIVLKKIPLGRAQTKT